MARPIREKSGTGVYHVMLRGINRQDIFEDEEDYLLIQEREEHISEVVKRTGVTYAHYFNKKRIMGTVLPIHFYTPHNMRYPSSQQAISGRAACLSLKGQKR